MIKKSNLILITLLSIASVYEVATSDQGTCPVTISNFDGIITSRYSNGLVTTKFPSGAKSYEYPKDHARSSVVVFSDGTRIIKEPASWSPYACLLAHRYITICPYGHRRKVTEGPNDETHYFEPSGKRIPHLSDCLNFDDAPYGARGEKVKSPLKKAAARNNDSFFSRDPNSLIGHEVPVDSLIDKLENYFFDAL